MTRPIKTLGTLALQDGKWSIVLEHSDPVFEVGAPVSLVLWDSREIGARSEIEEIARIQQLDVEIVALALAAEGGIKN